MPWQDSTMMKGAEPEKPMDPFMSRMRQAPASAPNSAPGGGGGGQDLGARSYYSSNPFAKMGGMGARAMGAGQPQQAPATPAPPPQAMAYGLRERLSQAPAAMVGRGAMGGGWNPNAASPDMQRRVTMDANSSQRMMDERGARAELAGFGTGSGYSGGRGYAFGAGAPSARGPEPMPPPRLPGGGYTGQGRRELPNPAVLQAMQARMGGRFPQPAPQGPMPQGPPPIPQDQNPFFTQVFNGGAGIRSTAPPVQERIPMPPQNNFYY